MKLSCIIIDDEYEFQEVIKLYVGKNPQLELVDCYSTAIAAREFLSSNPVDLIFLDIEMPGLSGMELIRSAKLVPQIVFVSSHAQYAAEAFEYDVTDFIVKPPSERRFNMAVEKAISISRYQKLITEQECLFFKVDSSLVKVALNNITCIESLGDYIKLYEGDNRHIILSTLNNVQNTLNGDNFMRVHRKFIVKLDAIKKIDGYDVHLESGKMALVSRAHKHELTTRLGVAQLSNTLH